MNKLFPFLLFISIFITGCSENKSADDNAVERTDKAYRIFNRAKAVEDIDEKLRLLSKAAQEIDAPEDTLLTKITDYQIYYHNINKSLDSSQYYANLMIDNARKSGDTATIALGYYRRGRNNLYLQNHINVVRDMYQSQRYYLLAGDSISAGKRLVELGIAQNRLGDFPESQNSQIRALSLLKDSGDSIYLSRIYNNLAITYRQLRDLDEAIDEYSNALKFAPSRRDSLSVLNNIANIYLEKGDYERSLKIFGSILPLAKEKEISNRIKDNYYFTLWLDSKIQVEDSLKAILEYRRKENDLSGLLTSQNHLTQINMEEDPREALGYAKDYYHTAQRLNNVSNEIKALGYLIRLSPPVENKKYSLEYMRLNDSLMDARDRVKNLFAKIKYDEEQKLEEIGELERLSSNQKLELLQERNRRNFAILLGLLLLAAALFLYYYLKQRHKKDTVRKIHDTEARISKKIHDELANDVFNVMTELENPTKVNREATLNKLESIYERTRNISRANTAIATGPDYKENLHYMLSRNTPEGVKLFLAGFQDVNWERMDKEPRIVIFRVLQELMINMKKHSNASIVSLNFRSNAAKLQISYNDNGVGVSSEEFKKGSGLQNVENRIASLGGSFTFQPDKKGLSIQIQIPV